MKKVQSTLRTLRHRFSGSGVSPPRVDHPVCHDLKSWAMSSEGAEYTAIDPERTTNRPLPKTIEAEVHRSFGPLCSFPVPERALVKIPNARIRGQFGLVILPNGEFAGQLVAVTPEGRHAMLRAEPTYYRSLPSQPTQKRKGSFYSLLGFGVNNYHHFSHDIIMRMRDIVWRLPPGVQFLVPEKMTSFQREILDLVGLSNYPLVPMGAEELCELEVLYVVSPLLKTQFDSAEPFLWYRKIVMESCGIRESQPTRRLYVTRRHDRYWRATNEEEVESFLATHGFQTISPGRLSVRGQIEAFADAQIIVGTGAGMTNMVFAPFGAKVVQLQETNHTVHSVWTMAAALGMDYHYFFCDVVPNAGATVVDIHVPIEKLEASLDRVTGA